MPTLARVFAGLLLAILLTTGCSKFQRIQKSTNVEEKYQAALNYYKKEDYTKAGLLFEELSPLIRGSKEAELLQFYYAYTQYHQGLYDLSAFQFKKFYETYSRSEYAEEAMFMHAYSLVENSPRYNLDQTNTLSAIQAIQNFINAYPESKRGEEAGGIITKLRQKLERKAFESAELYSKTQNYKAAVIALANFEREFPDSDYNERAAYLKVINAYNLARLSTKDKEKSRYEETIEYYENFVDKYAESKYLREMEDIYESSTKRVGEAAGAEVPTKNDKKASARSKPPGGNEN